jgi:transcriptional regulator with XRE-family HTH domain
MIGVIIMLSMANISFANWLAEETEKRGWSYRELGRRAELSSGAVSQVITQRSLPGLDFCTGVARAFNLPAEVVLRKASLLPPEPEETVNSRELLYIFHQLDDKDQERILRIARTFLEANKEKVVISEEKPVVA